MDLPEGCIIDGKNLVKVPEDFHGEFIIPDGIEEIGDAAFYGCTDLTSVHIPDGCKEIGGYVFYECTSLTSVRIPDGCQNIGEGAFADCSSLAVAVVSDGCCVGDGAFPKECRIFNSDRALRRHLAEQWIEDNPRPGVEAVGMQAPYAGVTDAPLTRPPLRDTII